MAFEKRTICADEHSRLMKIINFRLPHRFKSLGILSALVIFACLIGYKLWGGNLLVIKDLLRTVMLLFLLIASLSKEKSEDEFVIYLRYQSYVIAFVCSIAYALILPIVAFILDCLITNITDNGHTINFHEVSAFEVIFMLTCFQLLFFETLKRFERAQ